MSRKNEQALDQGDRKDGNDHRRQYVKELTCFPRDEKQGKEGDDVGCHGKNDGSGHSSDALDSGFHSPHAL